MKGVKEHNWHNKGKSVTQQHTKACISLFRPLDFVTHLFVVLIGFLPVKDPLISFIKVSQQEYEMLCSATRMTNVSSPSLTFESICTAQNQCVSFVPTSCCCFVAGESHSSYHISFGNQFQKWICVFFPRGSQISNRLSSLKCAS